jgi:hypothetical protein
MTLQEKFRESDSMNWRNAENVKIAEEFAIGFAEWSVAKAMGLGSFKLNNGELEIYKKEKGL